MLAEITQSLPLVLLSAAAGGIAGGLGYRGSLEVINRIAPADRRSEVVSNRWQFGGGHRHRIALATTGSVFVHITFAAVITVLAGIATLTGIRFAPNGKFVT